MPWKASGVMEEKLWFVFGYESDERSMTLVQATSYNACP